MIYGVLADLVVVTHLAIVVFVALGGLLALRWRWMPWLHLPAAAWGVFIEVSGGACPLTGIENSLRELSGEPSYTQSFVDHYLLPIIYPPALTREIQLGLAALVLTFNVAIYALVRHRHSRSV
jgi:hypothetical protein